MVGCDLFASVAEVSACVVSCSTVCMLKPVAGLICIVLVVGTNRPAIGTPTSSTRFSTISILVSPNLLPNRVAILASRLLAVVVAIIRSALLISPCLNAAPIIGWASISTAATASAARYLVSSGAVFIACSTLGRPTISALYDIAQLYAPSDKLLFAQLNALPADSELRPWKYSLSIAVIPPKLVFLPPVKA